MSWQIKSALPGMEQKYGDKKRKFTEKVLKFADKERKYSDKEREFSGMRSKQTEDEKENKKSKSNPELTRNTQIH